MSSKFQSIVAFIKKVGPSLQKAQEAYSTAEELKGQYDALSELADADDKEREKLVRDIAGIDGYLDAPIAAAKEARTNLEAMASNAISRWIVMQPEKLQRAGWPPEDPIANFLLG